MSNSLRKHIANISQIKLSDVEIIGNINLLSEKMLDETIYKSIRPKRISSLYANKANDLTGDLSGMVEKPVRHFEEKLDSVLL